MKSILLLCLMLALPVSAQRAGKTAPVARIKMMPQEQIVKDPHSFANPQQVVVRHVDVNLTVDFDAKVLRGFATLTVQRAKGARADLILDTQKLDVSRVEVAPKENEWKPVKFEFGKMDAVLGTSLNIKLPAYASRVRIHYQTNPEAAALQWLTPQQTSGKKHPYLFTQSQPIYARSWIPLQDSPGVRVTYSAAIKAPNGLVALMSADGNPQPSSGAQGAVARTYRFKMATPIPSYLIALAVGDIAFRATGPRSGVYDEPMHVDRAAKELEDVEAMMKATEKLYGPYLWGRYDVLVLPPSFPYGGMENPRLTFASPTIIAGDKSLVSIISHELAHSWSGNTVTNATWSDFWLNEGFTTYLERRIVEAVYGKKLAEMQLILGRQILQRDLASFEPRDQILHIDLNGRDPEEGSNELPYEKGSLFLKHIESVAGREQFDAFLRGYFKTYEFQSITTTTFLDYLDKNLLVKNPEIAKQIPIRQWIFEAGLPAGAPVQESAAFADVEAKADAWVKAGTGIADIGTDHAGAKWSTQEWLHFLKRLPNDAGTERLVELDRQYHFTDSGNIEVTLQWLLMAIRNKYRPAYNKLDDVLMNVGRRKIIKPLYEEMAKSPELKKRAQRVYEKAKPGYHPILVATVDKILGQ